MILEEQLPCMETSVKACVSCNIILYTTGSPLSKNVYFVIAFPRNIPLIPKWKYYVHISINNNVMYLLSTYLKCTLTASLFITSIFAVFYFFITSPLTRYTLNTPTFTLELRFCTLWKRNSLVKVFIWIVLKYICRCKFFFIFFFKMFKKIWVINIIWNNLGHLWVNASLHNL